jgi:hypothetical protein
MTPPKKQSELSSLKIKSFPKTDDEAVTPTWTFAVNKGVDYGKMQS